MFKRYQRATLDVVGMVNANRSLQTRLSQSIARVQREHLLTVARASLDYGLAAGRLSEVSLRVTGGKLLLTMRGAWFGALTERQLVVCGGEPNAALDTPELPLHVDLHRAIYAATEAKAVLLMQPAALMTIARQGVPNDTLLDSHAALFQAAWDDAGGIAFLDSPASESVYAATAQGVIVIRGVGALAHGGDGNDALARLHSAERWAQVALHTPAF